MKLDPPHSKVDHDAYNEEWGDEYGHAQYPSHLVHSQAKTLAVNGGPPPAQHQHRSAATALQAGSLVSSVPPCPSR